jgi:hypothetical protein
MRVEEENKGAYRSIIDAISWGDIGALEGLVAPDLVDHKSHPGSVPGLRRTQGMAGFGASLVPRSRGYR